MKIKFLKIMGLKLNFNSLLECLFYIKYHLFIASFYVRECANGKGEGS